MPGKPDFRSLASGLYRLKDCLLSPIHKTSEVEDTMTSEVSWINGYSLPVFHFCRSFHGLRRSDT